MMMMMMSILTEQTSRSIPHGDTSTHSKQVQGQETKTAVNNSKLRSCSSSPFEEVPSIIIVISPFSTYVMLST